MTSKPRPARLKSAKPTTRAKKLVKPADSPPDKNIKGGEKTVEFNDEIGPLSLVDYLWRNRID